MSNYLDCLELNDDVLAEMAHNGDDTAMEILLIRYKPIVRSKAARMYIAGAERDDVIQEGMIGLFKAVRAFDPRRKSFSALAHVCIMSQIKDAVRKASSCKQTVLNESLTDLFSNDLIEEDSPEKLFISREDLKEIRNFMEKEMTNYEREAIMMISKGYSYAAAGEALGKSLKSVDGAVQRARKKLGNFRRHQ
ncbi:MAG: sigma-70 family RNA polymerase sigma factor [Saccharofermentanales bacterium]